jgi:hypothetical protein
MMVEHGERCEREEGEGRGEERREEERRRERNRIAIAQAKTPRQEEQQTQTGGADPADKLKVKLLTNALLTRRHSFLWSSPPLPSCPPLRQIPSTQLSYKPCPSLLEKLLHVSNSHKEQHSAV